MLTLNSPAVEGAISGITKVGLHAGYKACILLYKCLEILLLAIHFHYFYQSYDLFVSTKKTVDEVKSSTNALSIVFFSHTFRLIQNNSFF